MFQTDETLIKYVLLLYINKHCFENNFFKTSKFLQIIVNRQNNMYKYIYAMWDFFLK